MAGHQTVAGGPVEHTISLLSLELESVNPMGCARRFLKLRSVAPILPFDILIMLQSLLLQASWASM